MGHQVQHLGDFGLELVGFGSGGHGRDFPKKLGMPDV
jgi:hypothetical protein